MARTVVTIIGMADRRSGTSKTGKPFDFVECAFQYTNLYGDKQAVACSVIDGHIYDKLALRVGDKYDAIVNQFNGKTYVDLIDPVY